MRMTTEEWSEVLIRVRMLSDADKARLITYLRALKGSEDNSTLPAADQPASQEVIQ